jgi:hypothetical protein
MRVHGPTIELGLAIAAARVVSLMVGDCRCLVGISSGVSGVITQSVASVATFEQGLAT